MIDIGTARDALTCLPEGTQHGEGGPFPEQVYLPPSHLKALDPNSMLVTGMRGAGKTFWWEALQKPAIRQLIDQTTERSALSENTCDVALWLAVRWRVRVTKVIPAHWLLRCA